MVDDGHLAEPRLIPEIQTSWLYPCLLSTFMTLLYEILLAKTMNQMTYIAKIFANVSIVACSEIFVNINL